jgi:hypothetical protein
MHFDETWGRTTVLRSNRIHKIALMQPLITSIITTANKYDLYRNNWEIRTNNDLAVRKITPCCAMNDPSVVLQEYGKSVDLC